MSEKLASAIDRLAAMFEFGELEASTDPAGFVDHVAAEIARLTEENERLQSGTYCAYCGQRYELADVQKAIHLVDQHIRTCKLHPIHEEREAQHRRTAEGCKAVVRGYGLRDDIAATITAAIDAMPRPEGK